MTAQTFFIVSNMWLIAAAFTETKAGFVMFVVSGLANFLFSLWSEGWKSK